MDVHPPSHPVHTWRDALVHLGIVTVGLLIAIGLEACVEWRHHQIQVREARESLARELAINIETHRMNTVSLRQEIVHDRGLLQDFQFLKLHPGASLGALPEVPYWWHQFRTYTDSAWKTAAATGVLAHMPPQEVQGYEARYSHLSRIMVYELNVRTALRHAYEYRAVDADPTHLTPAEVDREIDLCRQLLVAVVGLGVDLADLSTLRPEFPGPSYAEAFAALAPDPPEVSQALQAKLSEFTAASRAFDNK